MLLISKQAS